MNAIVKLYVLLIRFGILLVPIVLLLIRLAWGWSSYDTGWGHLHDLKDMTQFFEELHIPAPHLSAVISGTAEFLGGILLFVGFASRPVALMLTINFIVAIATDARYQLIHVFSAPGKLINYNAFPFLIAALVILAFGPGLISIDAILQRTIFRKHAA